MGQNITLKKLAEILKLSVPTVSRALNDSYEISQETKNRVNALAKELNYQPNPFASSLRKQKSKTIGLVVPEISNYFFSQVTTGVEHVCNKYGYHLIICSSNENSEKEAGLIYHLTSGKVDGILLSTSSESSNHEHIQLILDKEIPLVQFDRIIDSLPVSSVISNDFESSYLVTEKLIKDGAKKIVFLKFRNELSNIEKRVSGYQKALADNNAEQQDIVIELSHEQEINTKEIEKLILDKKPDAIFCSVGLLAIAVYDACHHLNINIPKDIKFITYSNINTARHLNPSLSTISKPAVEMGEKAAELLFNKIKFKENNEIEKVVIDSIITYRESTAIK